MSILSGRVFLCLALAFATTSCGTVQEYVSENLRTTIGAGVGTLGGALIGGLDSAGAAVAGGLIGGLAGGLVGRALEHKNEKTSRDYAYLSEGRETILRVEEVDTDPERRSPRERINLVTRYAVLPPQRDKEVSVTEKWTIRHNGRVVGNGGTWSSAIPITLPAGADPGTYEATVEDQASG